MLKGSSGISISKAENYLARKGRYNDLIVGVEWDTASSSPTLQQIDVFGAAITQKNTAWYDNHPVWGQRRRCLLSADGTPTFGTNARGDGLTLDGSVGQVMVSQPAFWVKSEKVGTKIRWWVSPTAYTGFVKHPWFFQRGGTERNVAYISAYMTCLGVTPVTGIKYLISKTGEQPFVGTEIVEVNFDSGSVAPVVGEVLTGATSLMQGTIVAFYVSSGSWAGGNAAGKIYLKMVSRRLTFSAGAHEPVVGEMITGATSAATGKVSKVVVTSGAWGTSDAAGYILLEGGSGNGYNYTVGENIRDPSSNTICAGQSDGSTLGQFTTDAAINGATGGTDIMTCKSIGSALDLTAQLSENYANNIGSTRWGCEDIHALDALILLFTIEYCSWNSQTAIAKGATELPWTRRFGGKNTGADSADSNIAANGTGTGVGTNGQVHVVYRGEEDPWGNLWQFVIGIDITDAAYRILKRDGTGTPKCPMDAGNYESSIAAPYTYDVPLRPDGYAKNILFEDLTKFLFLPNEVGASSTTYLCDYFWGHRSGQTNILLAGGRWNDGAPCGVGCRYADGDSSSSGRYIGARSEFV